ALIAWKWTTRRRRSLSISTRRSKRSYATRRSSRRSAAAYCPPARSTRFRISRQAIAGAPPSGGRRWRRRPDLNRGWRFCRPLPYHLATAPLETARGPRRAACDRLTRGIGAPGVRNGAGNGIRTRDFDLGKVALYH